MKSYTIYCDESIQKGKHFGNFFGGALIDNKYYDMVVNSLNAKKEELNLFGEVKWAKMSAQYLDKYAAFIEHYFTFIRDNVIKIRLMFRQSSSEKGFTHKELRNEFYLFYYEFFKEAFGFRYCSNSGQEMFLRIYFDKLPDSREYNERFKNYIFELQRHSEFYLNNIKIRREDIMDVDSHNHVILQGMDIILGAMQYMLNEEHKIADPHTGRRGKRTIAKEELYKVIYNNVNRIHPCFKIDESTDVYGHISNRWKHSYRHYVFTP